MTAFVFLALGFFAGAVVGVTLFIIVLVRFAGPAGGTIHHRVEHVEAPDAADSWKRGADLEGDE